MAKHSPRKVLRVALFRKGELFEEKLIPAKESVIIGSKAERNTTFYSPIATDLPEQFTLFEYSENKESQYFLRSPKGMAGSISLGDGLQPLSKLIAKGKKVDDVVLIPLTSQAYGTLIFHAGRGEHKVMFKFVSPPPTPAPIVVPRELKGGLFETLTSNRLLFVTALISFLLQIGIVSYISSQDWPQPEGMDRVIPDRFVTILQDIEREELEEEPVDPDEETESDEEGDTPQKPKEEEVESTPGKSQLPADATPEAVEQERRRVLTEDVRKKTLLSQIGATREGGGLGGLVDELTSGAASIGMEEAFKGSSGVETQVAGTTGGNNLKTGGSSDGDGTGTAIGIGSAELENRGAKAAAKGVKVETKKQEKQVVAKVTSEDEKVVGGALDGSSIGKVIARRMISIRACYERYLKREPGAKGKIVVQFTIGTVGRVTNSRAIQDTVGGNVGQCVASEIERMRFPKPSGGPATASKTFVFESNTN